MNTFGDTIKITLFGESHGEALGIVLDGIPAGMKIDFSDIDFELTKRRPKSIYSTSRSESDDYQILSGMYDGKTTGAALTFVIPNKNTQSKDYDELRFLPRPSHADYSAYVKYNGFNDPRGGGIFSGRLTALLVIAGAISKQILNRRNIHVASHIYALGLVSDRGFDLADIPETSLIQLQKLDFPVLDSSIEEKMKAEILKTKEDEDSVGGIVETCVLNLPAGIGDPLFGSLESYLSSLLFSVPSVKGVEFGAGFAISKMKGSQANDQYTMVHNEIKTKTNHNGGILGGITTSMPVVVRVAIKPTPSIGKKQTTVDLRTNKERVLEIKGRHDPAIVNRVVHVINAVVYFGILDFLSTNEKR